MFEGIQFNTVYVHRAGCKDTKLADGSVSLIVSLT